MEIEGLGHRIRRGPGRLLAPFAGTGLEDVGLSQHDVGLSLEEPPPEGQFNFVAIELGRLGVERHRAERGTLAAMPTAVRPRPHHQRVEDARVLPLGGAIGLERAREILGIEPSAHGHHRRTDVLQVGRDVVTGAPLGIGDVADEVVPEVDLALVVTVAQVADRPTPQEELISVGRAVVERHGLLTQRVLELLPEEIEEAEVVGQQERPAMQRVVAVEDCGHRGLRRHGLQRGMRIDHAHGREEARVRDAVHAHVAVVVAHVFDQPVDGVPGVGALVSVLRPRFHRLVGADVDEDALGGEAPAHILANEDKLLAHQPVTEARIATGIDRVRLEVVWGPSQEDGVLARLLRRVDIGEESHAVAHGNSHLALGVIGLEPAGVVGLHPGTE